MVDRYTVERRNPSRAKSVSNMQMEDFAIERIIGWNKAINALVSLGYEVTMDGAFINVVPAKDEEE